MEEELKEIEGLLENVETTTGQATGSKIKKYIKLVAPHVALVLFVCLYAVAGAYIFYSLESPNEDRLKKIGKAKIEELRVELVEQMRARKLEGEEVWRGDLERRLVTFNEHIYRAFKEQYVRYGDVRITREDPREVEGRRDKRHRTGKSRHERGEKLWTASSALFFAATTMATIGYGNIVPATSSGRIACVVFALFGAPLAIITIGDLGKFLSECTIWLYKKMKRLKRAAKQRICLFVNKEAVGDGADSDASSHTTLDWDGFVMDKSQVPVLLVFAILLLYIAFGGVLFAFLEDWTYMDAFYYSFISLTTIGFGDIVPENHDYIVLMLVYLGVGLAVTTMCIDLVGIQYIQKIHYFGRKFRGTDLLHLLKRKRMIERRLAMGQGEEILQMYIQHIQQQVPEAVVVEDKYDKESKKSEELMIEDMILNSVYNYHRGRIEKIPTPSIRSIRSWRPPSIWSNSSASNRFMMYERMQSRGGSFAESGPALSEHCSLSTEPSVHLRTAYWDSYRSPDPSVASFLFDFPLPSPDYVAIAAAAKSSRRVRSCPSSFFPSLPPSPIGMACMEDWDSYIRMLEDYNKPYISPLAESSSEESEVTTGFDIDLGAFELVDSGLSAETLLSAEDPVLFHQDMPVHSVHHDTVQTETALENLMAAPASMLSDVVPPTMVDDNYCFVVDGDKIRMGDIMGDDQWWRHTSRPTKYFYSEDLRKFHRVNCITAKGKVISAKLATNNPPAPPPTSPGGPTSAASISSTPRSSMSGASSARPIMKNSSDHVPLAHVYKVIRFYSFWRTCTSFHRIVTMIDKASEDSLRGSGSAGSSSSSSTHTEFKKRLFVQYLWRNAKAVEKARVQKEFDPRRQRLLRFVTDPRARKRMSHM